MKVNDKVGLLLRRKKVILMILILLANIAVMDIMWNVGKGQWQDSYIITENTIIEDINPSIGVDPNTGLVYISYTYDFPQNHTKDIYLAFMDVVLENHSDMIRAGMTIYDDEKLRISPLFLTVVDNDKSDIWVASDGDQYIVYQGRVNGTETDTEIFLDPGWVGFAVRVTDNPDTINDTDPQVVGLNGSTALLAWIEDDTTDKDIMWGTIDKNTTFPITGTRIGDSNNQTDVKLAVSGTPNNELIHMVYLSNGNIIYTNKTRAATNFGSGITVATGNYKDLCLSAKGNYVGITYMDSSNNIRVAISNDGGRTFSTAIAVPSGGTPMSSPSSYITDFGGMEIYYTLEVSSSEWDIYSVNNYGGSWSTPSLEFGGENNKKYYNPVIFESKDQVFGVYMYNNNPGSGWQDADIYIFAYYLFYNNSGKFSNFGIHDKDPYGDYLIEGLQATYNCSGGDINLNITVTDTVTNITYSNITTLTETGGKLKRILFWDPGHYMITKNKYNLTISTVNSGTPLLKVSFDPTWLQLFINYYDPWNQSQWEYDNLYNITNEENVNGTNIFYELSIGLALEYGGNGRFTKLSEGSQMNILDINNFADLGKIHMEKNERYNITFKTLDNGHVHMYLFNSSFQKLDLSTPIISAYRTVSGVSYFDVHCNETGDYYVLIQSESYNTTIGYYFQYSLCPGNITLTSPSNNYYIDYLTTNQINLKWQERLSDDDLSYYIVQISNTSDFNTILYEYKVMYQLGHNYTFTGDSEMWYYWRVKAVDTEGNEGYFDQVWRFAFDELSPDKPLFQQSSYFFNTTSFTIYWNVTPDHAFTVDYYNLYRSTDPNFTPSSSDLVLPEGTLNYPYFKDSVSKNDRYYYYLEAVDHVGHKSVLSDMLTVSVSYAGTVDATNQTFSVMVGDILVYKVTWVKSQNTNAYDQELMEFRGKYFEQGTIFHFWIKNIDNTDVFPVRGDFYSYPANITTRDYYLLEERDINLVPFVTTTNLTYQEACVDLYIKQLLPDYELGKSLNKTVYNSTWNDGSEVRKVVCYTYYGEVREDRDQTSATFMFDADTGIMVEMTIYDRLTQYGYSLKLIEATSKLSESPWTWAPLIIPGFIGVVSAVTWGIMKKLEL
ncbi:MAG: hypothetical protein ACTSVC_10625 [Promethearchaeota archaeon]